MVYPCSDCANHTTRSDAESRQAVGCDAGGALFNPRTPNLGGGRKNAEGGFAPTDSRGGGFETRRYTRRRQKRVLILGGPRSVVAVEPSALPCTPTPRQETFSCTSVTLLGTSDFKLGDTESEASPLCTPRQIHVEAGLKPASSAGDGRTRADPRRATLRVVAVELSALPCARDDPRPTADRRPCARFAFGISDFEFGPHVRRRVKAGGRLQRQKSLPHFTRSPSRARSPRA